MIPVTVSAPSRLQPGDDQVYPGDFGRHWLAMGDSWFSFGSLLGSGLLEQLQAPERVLVTNLARPGATLDRMVKWRGLKAFRELVHGRRAWQFDAILLSAGGNDLIDALPYLVKPGPDARACVDQRGLERFETYLRACFREVSEFVASSSHNAATPIYVHTYDLPTPRNAPALPGVGPWLMPHLQGIDPALWQPVTAYLFGRLAGILNTLGLVNVRVVNTFGACVPAEPNTTGPSGDWENEIHLGRVGRWKVCQQIQEAMAT